MIVLVCCKDLINEGGVRRASIEHSGHTGNAFIKSSQTSNSDTQGGIQEERCDMGENLVSIGALDVSQT